jgi:hypothetical protein
VLAIHRSRVSPTPADGCRWPACDQPYQRFTSAFEDVGPCENVNCSRRAPFSQLNLRLSKSFPIRGTARIEAIAEVFNLFNAKNPALPITSQRANAAGVQQASFMQPVAFAGDIQQPEQRIGQLGFRLSF